MKRPMSRKAKAVQEYQETCPQTLRAYVANLGYDTRGWTFEQLAEEWGLGYVMKWDAERVRFLRIGQVNT
jgi:hypothetical protein